MDVKLEAIEPFPLSPGAICIIFSKDRAMQLDATLRSLVDSCLEREDLRPHVLFAATSDVDRRQYEEVAAAHPDACFVKESEFQATLASLLAGTKFVLFIVDDTFFTAPWSLRQIESALCADERLVGVSLRLGANTKRCYSLDKPQSVPEMKPIEGDLVAFEWPGSAGDFGYPLEVSSSLYRTEDIGALLEGATFSNPNQLEDALYRRIATLRDRRPLLASFRQSIAFSNPLNVVQQEYPNRHGQGLGWTASVLRRMFDAGVRIDIAPYRGLVTGACHEEQPLRFLYPEFGRVDARIALSIEGSGAAFPTGGIALDDRCNWELRAPASQEGLDLLYLLGLLGRLSKNAGSDWLTRLAALVAEFGDAIEREATAAAAWRTRLRQTITELVDYQNQAIARQNELSAQRDELIVQRDELNEIVARQNAVLTIGAREIAERQAMQDEMQRQLDAMRSQIDAVYSSRSWRLTRPMRGAEHLARGALGRMRGGSGRAASSVGEPAGMRASRGGKDPAIAPETPFVSALEIGGPTPSRIRWQAQTLASLETLAPQAETDDLAERLAAASGKYLFLVSSTQDLEPNALERMVAALQANPGLPAITAQGNAAGGDAPGTSGSWAVLSRAAVLRQISTRDLAGGRPPVIPGCAGLPRIFTELHPFDEASPSRNTQSRGKDRIAALPLASPLAMLINPDRLRAPTARESVLAIVPWLPVGGAESLLFRIIASLSTEYEFIIVTTLSEQHAWHEVFRQIVPCIYHLPDFLPPHLWNEFLLLKIGERKIGRVLTSGSKFGYSFLPQAKSHFPELRTFALLHNDEWQGHRANALRVLSSIDHLIAVSDRIAATLKYLDGVDAARIAAIRNGIDADGAFSPGAVSQEAARRRFGLPADRQIVAFVGRLSPEKDPASFLAMIDRCPRRADVTFAIFGHGSLDEPVHERLAVLASSAEIHWIRHVAPEVMPEVYAAIDLLVITSNSEGLPLVLLEAMAMEVPAVAYDVGDIAGAIENGVSGIVVKAGDLEALIARVEQLIADPSARKAMGKAARRRLIELGMTEQQMLVRYREILRGRPAIVDAAQAAGS